jgi:hypothetical protein
MARVTGKAIRGAAGKVVYRTVNGQVIMSAKPSKYKKSKSRALLTNNKKFFYASGLAKIIKECSILYAAWEKYSQNESTPHNSIMSNNISTSSNTGLTVSNTIVPPSDYSLIKDISLINNSINVSIELFGNYFAVVFEKQLRIFLLFTGLNSTSKIEYKSYSEIFIPAEGVTINDIKIELKSDILDFINKYENVILFSTAVWTTTSPYELCWSSSYAKKI